MCKIVPLDEMLDTNQLNNIAAIIFRLKPVKQNNPIYKERYVRASASNRNEPVNLIP